MNAPLEELERVLGVQLMPRLIERFGGTRVYFPDAKKLTATHPLAVSIGLEAAKRICSQWKSERLYIPRAALARNERDRKLLADARTMSVSQLAREHKLTERAVYLILRRLKRFGHVGRASTNVQRRSK